MCTFSSALSPRQKMPSFPVNHLWLSIAGGRKSFVSSISKGWWCPVKESCRCRATKESAHQSSMPLSSKHHFNLESFSDLSFIPTSALNFVPSAKKPQNLWLMLLVIECLQTQNNNWALIRYNFNKSFFFSSENSSGIGEYEQITWNTLWNVTITVTYFVHKLELYKVHL